MRAHLSLVLSFFKGALFEPLEEASFENLIQKTMFLIVSASGRPHSKVHSFLGLPAARVFSASFVLMTVVELPAFLARNQAPTGSALFALLGLCISI